ncbi:MAG: response regulator, partial [Lentisphaeraceae bacterium]|nr:response regulator [Lentisphaeraceae bacterium]
MKSILVIERNEVLLAAIKKNLIESGHAVDTVKDSTIALGLMRKHTYKLVIIPLEQAEMNGLDFCRKLRVFNSISYLIGLSSNTSLYELSECRSVGFDDYMALPLNKTDLIQRVEMGIEKTKSWINCCVKF